MMRIVLFMATNAAVLTVVSIVMLVLGIGNPTNMISSLLMCAAFGMFGSIVSLFTSKSAAKRSTKTQVITTPKNTTEQWLLATVKSQADRAGIKMPEVGIFVSPQPNAFATGWNKDKSLVAVSTGILTGMTQNELEAVLGHEIGHIANGDMVTLALLQGIVNTFVLFFARIVGNIIDQVVFKNRNGSGAGYYISVTILQTMFGFLATMIVKWFSRYREFKADKAGAELASPEAMIAALERLKPSSQKPDVMPKGMQSMSISVGKIPGAKALFSTHPPLDVRIEALKKML